MRRTVLKYGLLAGLILVVFFLTTKGFWMSPDGKMDMNKGYIFGYVNMILSLSMVFFGVLHYRNTYLEGKINFGKALWVGFLIALVASAIYVIGWMTYANVTGSAQDFMIQYQEHMKQEWVESGMQAEEMAKKTEEFQKFMEMYKNPFFMALMTLFEILPVGILVALISAFLLKKK